MILDLSEWQDPNHINYEVLASELEGAIIRVQYGKDYEDQAYHRHLSSLKALGVPCAVYAWVRGGSLAEMAEEARVFYERAASYQPVFWWLDIEEFSMTDMRSGCEYFRQTLKACGAQRVGAYIANHLYHQFMIQTENFDAIWLPTYGQNTGVFEGALPTATDQYHLHQYTSNAKVRGYDGPVDANRLHLGAFSDLFPTNSDNVEVGSLASQTTAFQKTFQLTTAVYLVKGPSIYAPTIALLQENEVVLLQDFLINEGYLWGVQAREEGKKGYLALGEFQAYGTFLSNNKL